MKENVAGETDSDFYSLHKDLTNHKVFPCKNLQCKRLGLKTSEKLLEEVRRGLWKNSEVMASLQECLKTLGQRKFPLQTIISDDDSIH